MTGPSNQPMNEKMFYAGTSIAAGAIAPQSIVIAPLLVSVVITGFELSGDQAGFVMSSELLATAVVSFLIASRLLKYSRRHLSIVGAMTMVIACVLSMLISELPFLYLSRVLMGIGAGLVLASSNSCVASAANPDRLYACVVLATGITHLLLLSAGPVLTDNWSYAGAYGMQAGFTLLLLPFLFLLPHFPSGKPKVNAADQATSYSRIHSYAISAALVLFFAHNGAVWAFSQEIGRRTGMTDQQIGLILGITGFICLLGAVAAAILSTRIGRLKPLLAGIITCLILGITITLTNNAIVYTISQTFYQAAMFFTVPYLFGLAAKLDSYGRVMALAAGGMTFGSALGPAIAGFLIEAGGYKSVALFILIAIALVIFLSLLVNKHVELHSS